MSSKDSETTPPRSAAVSKVQQASLLDSPNRMTRYQLRRMTGGQSGTDTPETSPQGPERRRSTRIARSRHSVAGCHSEDSDAGSVMSEPSSRIATRRSTRASSQQPPSPPKTEVRRTRRNSLSTLTSSSARSTRNNPKLSPIISEELVSDETIRSSPRKLFLDSTPPKDKSPKVTKSDDTPSPTKGSPQKSIAREQQIIPLESKTTISQYVRSPRLSLKDIEKKLALVATNSEDSRTADLALASISKAATPKSSKQSEVEVEEAAQISPKTPRSDEQGLTKTPESGALVEPIRTEKSPEKESRRNRTRSSESEREATVSQSRNSTPETARVKSPLWSPRLSVDTRSLSKSASPTARLSDAASPSRTRTCSSVSSEQGAKWEEGKRLSKSENTTPKSRAGRTLSPETKLSPRSPLGTSLPTSSESDQPTQGTRTRTTSSGSVDRGSQCAVASPGAGKTPILSPLRNVETKLLPRSPVRSSKRLFLSPSEASHGTSDSKSRTVSENSEIGTREEVEIAEVSQETDLKKLDCLEISVHDSSDKAACGTTESEKDEKSENQSDGEEKEDDEFIRVLDESDKGSDDIGRPGSGTTEVGEDGSSNGLEVDDDDGVEAGYGNSLDANGDDIDKAKNVEIVTINDDEGETVNDGDLRIEEDSNDSVQLAEDEGNEEVGVNDEDDGGSAEVGDNDEEEDEGNVEVGDDYDEEDGNVEIRDVNDEEGNEEIRDVNDEEEGNEEIGDDNDGEDEGNEEVGDDNDDDGGNEEVDEDSDEEDEGSEQTDNGEEVEENKESAVSPVNPLGSQPQTPDIHPSPKPKQGLSVAEKSPSHTPGRIAEKSPSHTPGRFAEKSPSHTPGRFAEKSPSHTPGRFAEKSPFHTPGSRDRLEQQPKTPNSATPCSLGKQVHRAEKSSPILPERKASLESQPEAPNVKSPLTSDQELPAAQKSPFNHPGRKSSLEPPTLTPKSPYSAVSSPAALRESPVILPGERTPLASPQKTPKTPNKSPRVAQNFPVSPLNDAAKTPVLCQPKTPNTKSPYSPIQGPTVVQCFPVSLPDDAARTSVVAHSKSPNKKSPHRSDPALTTAEKPPTNLSAGNTFVESQSNTLNLCSPSPTQSAGEDALAIEKSPLNSRERKVSQESDVKAHISESPRNSNAVPSSPSVSLKSAKSEEGQTSEMKPSKHAAGKTKSNSKKRKLRNRDNGDSDYDFDVLDNVPKVKKPKPNSFQVAEGDVSDRERTPSVKPRRILKFVVRDVDQASRSASSQREDDVRNRFMRSWSITSNGNPVNSDGEIRRKKKKSKIPTDISLSMTESAEATGVGQGDAGEICPTFKDVNRERKKEKRLPQQKDDGGDAAENKKVPPQKSSKEIEADGPKEKKKAPPQKSSSGIEADGRKEKKKKDATSFPARGESRLKDSKQMRLDDFSGLTESDQQQQKKKKREKSVILSQIETSTESSIKDETSFEPYSTKTDKVKKKKLKNEILLETVKQKQKNSKDRPALFNEVVFSEQKELVEEVLAEGVLKKKKRKNKDLHVENAVIPADEGPLLSGPLRATDAEKSSKKKKLKLKDQNNEQGDAMGQEVLSFEPLDKHKKKKTHKVAAVENDNGSEARNESESRTSESLDGVKKKKKRKHLDGVASVEDVASFKAKKAKTTDFGKKHSHPTNDCYSLKPDEGDVELKKEKKRRALAERLERQMFKVSGLSATDFGAQSDDDDAPSAVSFSKSRHEALEEESRKEAFFKEEERRRREERKLKQERLLQQKREKMERKKEVLDDDVEHSESTILPQGKKTYFGDGFAGSGSLGEAGTSRQGQRELTSEEAREQKRREKGLARILQRHKLMQSSFIPAEAPTGTTRFGVVPLKNLSTTENKMAENAASFRDRMLFGNRIRRTPITVWNSQKEKKEAMNSRDRRQAQ